MAVAFIISRYSDKDGSNIECSLNTITTKAGISRRTTIEVLKLLIAESLLQVDGKARGGVIRYRMILGGSERVLASTSIPTALCQKDENSTTTNDAVRGSLTLAHTADKKTTPPDNFTTIATSTITPSPPQAHDPELLENDIRTIYANRHVRDSIRKGEFTDEQTLRIECPDVADAHDWVMWDFYELVFSIVDGLIKNRFFKPRHGDDWCGLIEITSKQYFRKGKKDWKGVEFEFDTEACFDPPNREKLENLLNDYLQAASEVICGKFLKNHPQLKPSLYDTDAELYYEGSELGITLDTDMITLETFNRDINRYINEYNQTHQHA